MTKDWFKYSTVVYENENKCYVEATSNFFDETTFSWQKIATKLYPMAGQWMMETRKRAPEPVFKMGRIIIALMTICDEITDILEELMCGCYFDDVKSIIEAIMTKNTTIRKNMTIAKNY